jgi:adenylate kinase family enzyme
MNEELLKHQEMEDFKEDQIEIVLIRGLPGSGKSTMARAMAATHVHLEADTFFVTVDGQYKYDPKKIARAHEWCQNKAREALARGRNVVVSNTFCTMAEIRPYIDIAKEFGATVKVIEAKGQWTNVHGVPPTAIEKMRSKWEPLDDELLASFRDVT